ncbi:hypothetical protein AAF712_015192 [Marasmius tenuissimus]|uniref:Uncharacterized protein n=1 Tax=Marasmius tenuissimus TaxID=585030 RepID=A0ABR2Z9X1_9AGAR
MPVESKLQYLSGHGKNDSCCRRPHRSVIEYFDEASGCYIRIPALAVNFYAKYNEDLRHTKSLPDWCTDSGYYSFARMFNRCVASHKFAVPVPVPEDRTCTTFENLEYPSPPAHKLSVELHQCMDNESVLPGYVSVLKSESLREKAERKAQRGLTGHAAGGFASYVDKAMRARQQKKDQVEILYKPSSQPSALTSSKKKPKGWKNPTAPPTSTPIPAPSSKPANTPAPAAVPAAKPSSSSEDFKKILAKNTMDEAQG